MNVLNQHNGDYFGDSVALGASYILFNPYINYTMNHYYLYIDAGRVIDSTARFFKVAVPSSQQGQRDYLFLVAHSVERNHFFELWSQQVAEFLWNIGQSLADGCVENPLDFVHIQPISARELVRNMRAHVVDPMPDFVQRNQNHMRHFLNVNYRVSSSFFRR